MSCVSCDGALYRGDRPYQIDALACRDCQRSPAVQMRVLLAACRERGLEFDAAWDWADARVRWPHDKDHRWEWKAVLRKDPTVKETWRGAYLREPAAKKTTNLAELVAVAA